MWTNARPSPFRDFNLSGKMNKLKPNFTQIPNLFLDELMHDLNGSELKVLLYIMRRTYGFQKQSDRISISQICSGIKKKDGDELDKGTGLSKQGVVNALNGIEAKTDILESIKGSGVQASFFRINLSGQKSRLVKKVDQSGQKSRPLVVKKVDTQKKEKESIQKKDMATGSQVNSLIDSFKEINPIYEQWFKNTTQRNACENLLTLMEYEKLLSLVQKVLPVTNRRQYAPTITTPLQLYQKFAQLESYLIKEKDKKDNNFKVLC